MSESLVLGVSPDGSDVVWSMSRPLIVTAPARTGGTTLLLGLLERMDTDRAYVNVASSHIPDKPDGIRMAGRDRLEEAIGILESHPSALAVDGMEYWLRGPDATIPNESNNPEIAGWNERMRRSAHLRAVFRDRLTRLMETKDCTPILLFRTTDADGLLGRWPVGVTPTMCDRLCLDRPLNGSDAWPATFTPVDGTPISVRRVVERTHA